MHAIRRSVRIHRPQRLGRRRAAVCRASSHLALETLKVGAIGVAISAVSRVPLGVWLGHIHRGSFFAINLGNIGRALPSLAVLAIGDAFLGLGLTVVELALVILAVPPIVTNAYLAVDGVEPRPRRRGARDGHDRAGDRAARRAAARGAADLRRAAHGVGVRRRDDDDRALAGFSGRLGDIIANETSYHFAGVLGAAICVAALALAVDGVLALVQRALTPRGVRLERGDGLAPAAMPA